MVRRIDKDPRALLAGAEAQVGLDIALVNDLSLARIEDEKKLSIRDAVDRVGRAGVKLGVLLHAGNDRGVPLDLREAKSIRYSSASLAFFSPPVPGSVVVPPMSLPSGRATRLWVD